jgi:hypothetical protein
VRSIDLAQADAVECHPRVVNGRLEFTHGFLQYPALIRTVRDRHEAPSHGYELTDGTLPMEFVIMPGPEDQVPGLESPC